MVPNPRSQPVDEPKTKALATKVAGIGVEGKALLVDTMSSWKDGLTLGP